MKITLESVEWFNQVNNGLDFTLNPSENDLILRGNVGEKVLIRTLFTLNDILAIGPTTNFPYQVQIPAAATDPIELITPFGDTTGWSDLGYYFGQTLEFYDNLSASVVATITITGINNAQLSFTGSTTAGTYSDLEVRVTSDNLFFDFSYDLLSSVSGSTEPYLSEYFGRELRWRNATAVGVGGPRSTAFVDFDPIGGDNIESGRVRMRYVDNPDAYTQRFESEHEFIIQRIDDGDLESVVPNDEPYKFGTLEYELKLNVAPFASNGLHEFTFNSLQSVGWFNENFNNGGNDYGITSASYFDIIAAVNIDKLDVNTTTQVTLVVSGVNFQVGDPVVVHFSKIPPIADVQDDERSYFDIFVNDAARSDLDGAPTSSTIIQNYSAVRDSAVQCTLTFDMIFSGGEDLLSDDEYIFYVGLLDQTLVFPASNRVNLLADFDTITQTNDESTNFEVTKFEIYNHCADFGVDTPSTDFVGYVEDGILFDVEFKIRLFDSKNLRRFLERLHLCFVAYDTANDKYVNISEQSTLQIGRERIDGSVTHFDDMFMITGTREDFLLADDDQFNKGHSDSPTFASDVAYVSNDGTDATYRMTLGWKLGWQELAMWNRNTSISRPQDAITRLFNSGGLNTASSNDVGILQFQDVTQALGGFNRKIDNFSTGNWIIRPLLYMDHDNEVQDGSIPGVERTKFYTFGPEFSVYDYDTNSTYTATHKTETIAGDDLSLTFIQGEDCRIIITFDDGNTKTDVNNFKGIVRLEVKNQTGFEIHELSTFRDTYPGNFLKGEFGDFADKSIVSGNYVLSCLVDGSKITEGTTFSITGRLFDIE